MIPYAWWDSMCSDMVTRDSCGKERHQVTPSLQASGLPWSRYNLYYAPELRSGTLVSIVHDQMFEITEFTDQCHHLANILYAVRTIWKDNHGRRMRLLVCDISMRKRSVQRAVSQCRAWNAREGASLSLVSCKALSSCSLALKSAEKHQNWG